MLTDPRSADGLGGMVSVIAHPIRTVNGIGEAAGALSYDPAAGANAVRDQVVQTFTHPSTAARGFGNVSFAAVSFAVPVSGAGAGAEQITTVIGRMEHLEQFASQAAIDTWAKSGRIPSAGKAAVNWSENQAWLDARIAR